jgi:hypothetical protein
MSIASVLTRLEAARVAIIAAIEDKGGVVPSNTGLEALPDFIADISSGGGAFVPSAFAVGDWTAAAAAGQINLNITALPSDGGTPITALQYRIDGGTAVGLSGTGTGARTISGLAAGVEYDVQIRAVNALGAGAWSDTKSRTTPVVPSAFTSGNWTATPGDGEVVLNITALPSNGGTDITALQYRIDGGTWTNLTGTGTGSRTITGLTNATEYDFELRAVNAVGNGAASDVKSATPEAAVSPNPVHEGLQATIGTLHVLGVGITAAKPAGTVASDLLIAILEVRGNDRAIVSATGWTPIVSAFSDQGTVGGLMAYRAPGDVATTQFVLTEARGTWNSRVVMHRISGANASTPIRASAASPETSTADANWPSPTVTIEEGDLVLSDFFQPQSLNAVGTPTAGFTRIYEADADDDTAEGRRSVLLREDAPAGATGSISHAASSAYTARAALTIAIRA